jgi:hypothetical protein
MMKKVKRLWMPLLLGALLMATLAGVAGARPNARPEASPALVDHMFSAQHCVPYYNLAAWIFQAPYVACPTAPCGFACPVKPPHEGLIRVQRLAMYVYDNGANDVCISLQHAYPKTGTYVSRLINQCTTDNAADPQVISYNPANFKVSQLQDLYVGVVFSGTTQKLYGFKVKYEPL